MTTDLDAASLLRGLIALIRANDGMAGRLLAEHTVDTDGRCAGCSTYSRPVPGPCLLRTAAEATQHGPATLRGRTP